MQRLSRNFTLAEFTRSDTASKLGLSNEPSAEHLANLKVTALGLEMVRLALYEYAVRVHSGYRAPAVNEAVGGTPTSAHAEGYAADITVDSYTPLEVAKRLRESTVAFDQLIYEPSRGVVHISFDPRLRREILTQKGGAGTPIVPGIVP